LALHVQGQVRLPADFTADLDFATGRPAAFGYWRAVRGATYRDHTTLEVDYGGVVMRVTLATPGEFKLWHGSSPDVPPRRRESFYLELKSPATSATFTTRFEPVK
jgi:hypothetical protein